MYDWIGEHAVTGKFKFLTCSIVSSELRGIPIKLNQKVKKELKQMAESEKKKIM
jgi:hypothetical protein